MEKRPCWFDVRAGIDKAAAAHTTTIQYPNIVHEIKPHDAKASCCWCPDEFGDVPIGFGKIVGVVPFAAFKNGRFVPFLRQPHR